jgi:hypothetical protein
MVSLRLCNIGLERSYDLFLDFVKTTNTPIGRITSMSFGKDNFWKKFKYKFDYKCPSY